MKALPLCALLLAAPVCWASTMELRDTGIPSLDGTPFLIHEVALDLYSDPAPCDDRNETASDALAGIFVQFEAVQAGATTPNAEPPACPEIRIDQELTGYFLNSLGGGSPDGEETDGGAPAPQMSLSERESASFLAMGSGLLVVGGLNRSKSRRRPTDSVILVR